MLFFYDIFYLHTHTHVRRQHNGWLFNILCVFSGSPFFFIKYYYYTLPLPPLLSPSIFIIYYLIFIFYSTTPRPHSLSLSLSSFPFLLCVLFVFFSPTPEVPHTTHNLQPNHPTSFYYFPFSRIQPNTTQKNFRTPPTPSHHPTDPSWSFCSVYFG